MPSTNHFKFGASGISSATRGGFKVGVSGGADYGPTSTTGFWNGVTPPVGGYTIYVDKASQGPSIHVASNNAQCIGMLLAMGATGSTIENVLAWADGQANMAILSAELTLNDLYTIGQAALGGIVAYILQSGDTGYDAQTPHGLVISTSDTGFCTWGCAGTLITGADGTAIGTGNQNTVDILAQCAESGIAARLCGDLVENGYSDWYLPSKDEMHKLFLNKNLIGMNNSNNYLTSSEIDADTVWYQYFGYDLQGSQAKGGGGTIARPMRSF